MSRLEAAPTKPFLQSRSYKAFPTKFVPAKMLLQTFLPRRFCRKEFLKELYLLHPFLQLGSGLRN
jgi:hypothetical protein